MGHLILTDACKAARSWLDSADDPPPVAINVSPRQVADNAFVATVAQSLAMFDLPASQLREKAAMVDPEATLVLFEHLSALGVGLVLDDVGDGRSSLSHLARFPVHMLAMSRAFSTRVLHANGADATVHAVVGLARELGLTVAAKGIERPDQAQRLRALGCSVGQGPLYGRPQKCSAFIASVQLTRQVA